MKIDVFENALSGINETALDSVLTERHKRMEKASVNTKALNAFRLSKRNIAVVAVAVLLICISVILPLSVKNLWNGTDPVGTEGTDQTIGTDTPQYIPAYDTPSLEEVYALAPFSELLPRKFLPNCAFKSSYMSKYDPIANPNDSKFLSLVFSTGKASWDSMEIKISEYKGSEIFADIHNKKTYALSYIYGDGTKLSAEERENFSNLFHAEDITLDIVNESVCTLSDGLCKAGISVLCGDHIVSYAYTGAEIKAEEFYNMILSSRWFSFM